MKTLVKILASLVGFFVLAGVVLYFTGSEKIEVEVSKTINKPIEQVFGTVTDFKTWEKWSAWAEMDPEAKRTITGIAGELGHQYCWESENPDVGYGCQTISKIEGNTAFQTKLVFTKPFEGEMIPEFKFEEIDGGTKVTWIMNEEMGVPDRIFDNFMDMNGTLKGQFEKSLEKLSTL